MFKATARGVIGAAELRLHMFVGPPGAGKSRLMVFEGIQVQEILGHPLRPEDLVNQMRAKPKDLPEMAVNQPKRRYLMVDEGTGEGGNRLQPMLKENVNVGMDLDTSRGREQPIGYSGPHRLDISRQIQKHANGAWECHKDFTATYWEAEQPDSMFGKDPYFHERFNWEVPWLGDVYPKHEEAYAKFKDLVGRGVDVATLARQRHRQALFRGDLVRLLG